MAWHGFWWQWVLGGWEAVLAFATARHYTNPVRRMDLVKITLGSSKHVSIVSGRRYQKLQTDHRWFGYYKVVKRCTDCGTPDDVEDIITYKVPLCPRCGLKRAGIEMQHDIAEADRQYAVYAGWRER